MSTWTAISVHGTLWVSVAGGTDDWVDPRLTPLLTESGPPLLAESGSILVTEAVTPLASVWVHL